MTPHDQEKLERAVHDTLRALPPRSAPRSLEARVQAEIARRSALPWWRKSFGYWPVAARAAFVVAAIVVVKGVFSAATWASAGVSVVQVKTAFASELAWLQAAGQLMATGAQLATTLFQSIPAVWLYGGLTAIAALYVALFGLGAAAYRTLYASS